jgi:hypothetical protein
LRTIFFVSMRSSSTSVFGASFARRAIARDLWRTISRPSASAAALASGRSSVTSTSLRSECTRCAITTATTRSRSTIGIKSALGGIEPPSRNTIESMLGSPLCSGPMCGC